VHRHGFSDESLKKMVVCKGQGQDGEFFLNNALCVSVLLNVCILKCIKNNTVMRLHRRSFCI
jgi:hypothetical protein